MAAVSQMTFFKCILMNEKIWILIKISQKFVPTGLFNNRPEQGSGDGLAPTDKPLSEVVVRLPTRLFHSMRWEVSAEATFGYVC